MKLSESVINDKIKLLSSLFPKRHIARLYIWRTKNTKIIFGGIGALKWPRTRFLENVIATLANCFTFQNEN